MPARPDGGARSGLVTPALHSEGTDPFPSLPDSHKHHTLAHLYMYVSTEFLPGGKFQSISQDHIWIPGRVWLTFDSRAEQRSVVLVSVAVTFQTENHFMSFSLQSSTTFSELRTTKTCQTISH